MLHRKFIAVMALTIAAALVVDSADARRLGSGRSFGAQRSVTPPAATAPGPSAHAPGTAVAPGAASNPVMPPSAAAARAGAPAAAAAAPAQAARPGMSRWLGPIAGLAAGLGLAALMSHFGLSEAFGSFMLMLLLALGVFLVVRMLFMRRSKPQYATSNAYRSPMTGDLASRTEPVLGGGAAGGVSSDPRLPAGFDREAFIGQAKAQFRALQGAWDAGDRRALSNVTTPEMYADIDRDLATRGTHQDTDIVSLDADLLEVTTEGPKHWASVRFWGVLREDGGPARSFDETWNLVKPVDDSSGWMLAGIQQNEPATAH